MIFTPQPSPSNTNWHATDSVSQRVTAKLAYVTSIIHPLTENLSPCSAKRLPLGHTPARNVQIRIRHEMRVMGGGGFVLASERAVSGTQASRDQSGHHNTQAAHLFCLMKTDAVSRDSLAVTCSYSSSLKTRRSRSVTREFILMYKHRHTRE